jgi:methionyl-tRNA formyltransferase
VLRAAARDERAPQAGQVFATPEGPAVGADAGSLLLLEVQPPGKRPMSGAAFVLGARGFIGDQLG